MKPVIVSAAIVLLLGGLVACQSTGGVATLPRAGMHETLTPDQIRYLKKQRDKRSRSSAPQFREERPIMGYDW
ncbi:MAG: hypothetical protein AAF236_10965 [Verrucomicrobiota bacterium]